MRVLIAWIEGAGPSPTDMVAVEAMRWMGWSCQNWDDCPAWRRDDIIERMTWTAKLRKK